MVSQVKKNLISGTAITWSLVQLYCAFTFAFDILQVEILHITFALILVFLLKPGPAAINPKGLTDYFLALLSLLIGIYFICSYPRMLERIRFVDDVLMSDIAACIAILFLVLEGGRRLMGWGLTILGMVTIAYAFLGYLIPGALGHSAVTLDSFTEFMVLTQEGVFGIPLRVSTTYVFLFVLFGAFLKYGRLGAFYNDLAVSVAGGMRGGPGKVAVVSSSLLGTISGSAVANVSTSGTFTIPMMIRAGYSPSSAGAIEALASTGSQLVPPIMGAAAFIMAELTRIPYWTIAAAAIIPSVLYYIVVYSAVHFESVREEMGIMQDERKPFLKLIVSKGYMFFPIAVIIYYLGSGHSITLSATMAILASFLVSVIPIVARRQWREAGIFLKALEDGAKSSIVVALPCAIAGIIVGVLTLTGLGLKFTEIILSVSGDNVLILLLITSFICLILGMGMPTSAAYITVAILAVPALIKADIPVLTAHFFGFYFANLSMITPPVALAAFAGAGISGANCNKVGVSACTMGLALYLIPFLLVTYPPLMLIGGWGATAFAVLKAGIIVICFTAAIMGTFSRRLIIIERLLFIAAGISLWITAYPLISNMIGLSCLVIVVMRSLRGKHPAAA